MANFYYGWGNVGCLYDGTSGPYETLEDAVTAAEEVAETLAYDFCDECVREMANELVRDFSFVNSGECTRENPYGAECARGSGFDYVELFEVED